MCPNTISPSMCCSSISGTCSSSQTRTTIIDIQTTTTTKTAHQDDNKDTTGNTFLQSLSSQLNILTAGSLFLLPSILPFLASALTADSYPSSSSSSFFTPGSSVPLKNNNAANYVSPSPPLYAAVQVPSVPGATSTTAFESASAWTWTTTWIMLLPCLGVVLPLALFKIMTLFEEHHGIQCPYTRWSQHRRAVAATRQRGSVRRSMSQSNCCHGATDGPTLKAIKRFWRNLLRIESDDFLGFAHLPLAYQDEVNAEEGLCVSDKEDMHLPKVDFTKSHQRRQVSWSALPRPKTILLASLWAWTMLMVFSAKMGFNSLQQISVPPPSLAVSSPSPMPSIVPYSNVVEQGGSGAPIFILPAAFPADLQTLQVEEQDNHTDLLLDMDIDLQFETLWAQDQQPAVDSQEDGEAQPFARIQTSIVIINNNDDTSSIEPTFDNMMEDDIEDLNSLDAMIMDSQDEAVFHDFLNQLDQEDAAAALRTSQDEPQDQQQQERLNKLIKATDDLMVASMLDNDLPCRYYRPSTPTWFSGIQQFLVGDSIAAAGSDMGGHLPGRTFIYTGWSTDLMILAVAMCLGGVLVGLAQSKILYHQLLDQHMDFSGTNTLHRRASWKTLVACLALSGSALGLTFLMIADESWDVPAIYFVGIGIAGIILVHAWVPNAALIVHKVDDSINEYSSDDDDEDTCIGSDTEMDVNSSKFSDETPLVWSPPSTERRNACSLDENRRLEVVTAAIFHKTAC